MEMSSKNVKTTRDRTSFLPDFCRMPIIGGVLLTGQLLGLTLALASYSTFDGFLARLGPLSLFMLALSLLSCALLCSLRPMLSNVSHRTAALLAWCILTLVAGAMAWSSFTMIPQPYHESLFPREGLPGLMIRSLGISAILSAMLLRYLYLHHLWRLQVEAEAEARFQALQARIRPHFLFNSMNTIANLTQTNPRIAEEVVQDLADLFRAALSDAGEYSTLEQELKLARRYLNVEKQRLGDRLQVGWELRDLPWDAQLPTLILQPLVENAVYHGIQPSRKPGLVQLGGHCGAGRVTISIRNTLPSADESAVRHSDGNRMAQDNVIQRMNAMFEGKAQVVIARTETEYEVRLIFPYPWKRP